MFTFADVTLDPPREARAGAAPARPPTVHDVGPPASAVAARYFQPRVRGPVYQVGGVIPARGTGHPMKLDAAQLARVAAQLRDRAPVLWEHDKTIGHAGHVTGAHVDARGVLHAEATLYSPSTWTPAGRLREAIRTGKCSSFSLAWDEDRDTGECRAVELSVCDKGFFPVARIEEAFASAPPPLPASVRRAGSARTHAVRAPWRWAPHPPAPPPPPLTRVLSTVPPRGAAGGRARGGTTARHGAPPPRRLKHVRRIRYGSPRRGGTHHGRRRPARGARRSHRRRR